LLKYKINSEQLSQTLSIPAHFIMLQFFQKYKHPFPLIAAAFISILYFSIPFLADYVVAQPYIVLKYVSNDVALIKETIQKVGLFPIGRWLSAVPRAVLVFPYWYLIFSAVRWVYLRFQRVWNVLFLAIALWIGLVFCFPNLLLAFESKQPSSLVGNKYVGGIKNAKRIHFQGKNWKTYSFLGYFVGRTFVHDKVRATIEEAYKTCETTCPTTFFTLGETGLKGGGRFLPHRSHQSGMSVDFMVPLLDKKGNNYLGYTPSNLWGYTWEFDKSGKLNDWTMDFEATARHILAIEKAAAANGLTLGKIIFDPDLQPELFATPSGAKIKHLPFTPNPTIWRHDEHFHIDFELKE
jgi:penicillin-insensitive murein DD-endopeptidase